MEEGLIKGTLAGIICFLLGLIVNAIYPSYTIDLVIALSLGVFVGNFIIGLTLNKIDKDELD